MRSGILVARSGLAALVIALAAPVTAQAATASFLGGVLTVTGDAAGETFTISDEIGSVQVVAPGLAADPDGAGVACTLVVAGTVRCLDGAVGSVVVDGNEGADTINFNRSVLADTFTGNGGGGSDVLSTALSTGLGSGTETLNGGLGEDTLTGSDAAAPKLNGNDDNDTLNAGTGRFGSGDTGGPGNDVLNGNNEQSDRFHSEPGADTYSGGTRPRPPQLSAGDEFFQAPRAASDAMFYSGAAAVSVTLDDVANDGAAGEGDNVKSDIESISGGDGNDVLDASSAATEPKTLSGGRGDDTLTGGAKDDVLSGDNGFDTLNGGAGDDRFADEDESIDPLDPVTDQAGNDTYNGGDGDDSFFAASTIDTTDPANTTQRGSGLGADAYNGGAGVDFIYVGRTAVSPRTPDANDPSDTLTTHVPVSVTLDGVANDGHPGAAYRIAGDIEDVSTGEGADTIVGNDLSNVLAGGGGNDTINGLGGVDLIYGDNGIDAITSRDLGFDKVNCGLGVDAPVQGDVGDLLAGCEGTAVLTALRPPADTTKPSSKLSGPTTIKAKRFLKSRTIAVTVTPSEPAILEGELFAGARAGLVGQTLLGRGKLGLRAGGRTLKIKVSKPVAKRIVKRALRSRKGAAVTVSVLTTDAAGLSSKARRTIKIKR